MKRSLLFLLPLLSLACWVQSIEPFYQDQEKDSLELPDLPGLWMWLEESRGEEPPDRVYFRFEARQDRPGYHMTVYEEGATPVILEAHAFAVGDRLFLDTVFEDFVGEDPFDGAPVILHAHLLPVHLAWGIRRTEQGYELGLLGPEEGAEGLKQAAADEIPRIAPSPDSWFDPLILTGPSASAQEALARYPEELDWLALRRVEEVRFPGTSD